MVTGGRRRILSMGERAVLVELDGLDAVLALSVALSASAPAGVEEIVPAARTLLVRFDPAHVGAAQVRAWVADAALAPVSPPTAAAARPVAPAPASAASAPPSSVLPAGTAPDPADIVLDIVYDGPDLAATAAGLGLSVEELVGRHSRARWRVAFTGFAPGFGYLVSDEWPHDIPRLDAPRSRVPPGSVGLAGGFTGAYPRETPGGWRLIGTTPATLFDPASADPVLLSPGASVRFRAVPPSSRVTRSADRPGAPGGAPVPSSPDPSARAATEAFRIAQAGAATVQDLGRAGRAHLGIARSGALDRGALRLANRLVGNAEGAAAIEVALGGFIARAHRDLWIAITGAWGPIRLGGRPVDSCTAVRWRAGEALEIGWLTRGARVALAVRGGIEVPASAGSRSTDTLAGLGPAALRAGDELAIGVEPATPVPPLDIAPWGWPADPVEVGLTPGPRADWFAASAHRTLFAADWTVSAQADRIGMRLDGPVLDRIRPGELPSEGMVPGALQVPPSGRPTILLADAPVTGGYPVIAVVTDAALDRLAQAAPGARLRFRRAPR